MGILDNLESSLEVKLPGYKQTPPDWCDDCTIQDSVCTICGCSHNC